MKTLCRILILLLCLSIATPAHAIAPDKLGHFTAGFFISGMIGGEAGLWAGIVAGAAKEGYDYTDRQHHSVEAWDFIATALGSYAAYLIRGRPKPVRVPGLKIELYDGSKI